MTVEYKILMRKQERHRQGNIDVSVMVILKWILYVLDMKLGTLRKRVRVNSVDGLLLTRIL
jgi:hypothetical protein